MATLINIRENDIPNDSSICLTNTARKKGKLSSLFLKLCCCGPETKSDESKRDKRIQRRSVLPSSSNNSVKSQKENLFNNGSKKTFKESEAEIIKEENILNDSTNPGISLHQRRRYQKNIDPKDTKISRPAHNFESEKYILNKMLDEDKIVIIDEEIEKTTNPRAYDSQESERKSKKKRKLIKRIPKKKSTEPLPKMTAKNFHGVHTPKGGFDIAEINKITQIFRIMESESKKEYSEIAQNSQGKDKLRSQDSFSKEEEKKTPKRGSSEGIRVRSRTKKPNQRASIAIRMEDHDQDPSDGSMPRGIEKAINMLDNNTSGALKIPRNHSKQEDGSYEDLDKTSSLMRQDSVSNEESSK
ncbi:unnamed protein product [Moneuplotes crassus]|uniref:Uncharacterized protein n=1 Tax=Euplotes crassus TaxID=5936 RepID=A0AAD1X9J3_EUPCR|nr:unnamed protein product [Moneuplotes crassus]